MRFCLMAFCLRRRLKRGSKRALGRHANVIALMGLSAALISPAAGQTVSGHSGPEVTVDQNVLERLGPPAAAKAPAKKGSSRDQTVHLIPPKSRVATTAPSPSSKTSQPTSHEPAPASTPGKPGVAALASPAPTPAPKQPASGAAPASAAATPPTVTARDAGPAPNLAATSPETAAANAVAAPPPSTTPTAPSPVASAAPPKQVATASTVGSAITAVNFKPGVTDLGGGAQPVLDALVGRLLANQELRVELISHATGAPDDAMEARRVSLARAVAVRAYLVEKGVKSLRIDVRALGNRADGGPVADQVDLQVVSQ